MASNRQCPWTIEPRIESWSRSSWPATNGRSRSSSTPTRPVSTARDAKSGLDRTSFNGETALSPRLAASFAVTPNLSARATAGRYTQSPGYEKTAQSDYLLNFTPEVSEDTTPTLRSERADIASLSLERPIGNGAIVRVETYYKRLTDLLIGRIETEPERLARLAEYSFPPELASSLPVEPIITTAPTNDGRGRAYGVDVLWSRMSAPVNARFRGWVSYTWGKAEIDAYGRRYPFDYDRRMRSPR